MAPMTTSGPAVFVFLTSILCGNIRGSTQSVTQPCERNKRAISLCERSSDNRPSGFLTYNMSTSPEWCKCSLSTDQKDTMDVQYSTTGHNATYDFVFHVARGGGGNITGRHGHWNDIISKQMPWTVYLSKANLETERAAIQGLCFSYEVKNEASRLSIVCHSSDMELSKSETSNISLITSFLSGLACVLAFAAVVVVFICRAPRCVRCERQIQH
ncbi:uncharacterized protein LOC124289083 [Haliotis rubra]|uniref:uncharacterized protein LOC124289083 n=1 Tax=Haliotis rubra TaxID=36100 RepID=UPI001EE5E281|nr:uncharacterized protein LOC124289083 [Haliotis rubra]